MILVGLCPIGMLEWLDRTVRIVPPTCLYRKSPGYLPGRLINFKFIRISQLRWARTNLVILRSDCTQISFYMQGFLGCLPRMLEMHLKVTRRLACIATVLIVPVIFTCNIYCSVSVYKLYKYNLCIVLLKYPPWINRSSP